MKFNRSSRKLRTLFILSLSSLSAFSGNANAMEFASYSNPSAPVMVQQPAGQPIVIQNSAAKQDSIGDTLIKEQVAKNFKQNRKRKNVTTFDKCVLGGGVSLFLADEFIPSNAKITCKGIVELNKSDQTWAIQTFVSNPLKTPDEFKSLETKSLADWGINEKIYNNFMSNADMPENKTMKSIYLSQCECVCLRSDLKHEDEGDNKRIYAPGKKDPWSGKDMKEDDMVWNSQYRYEKVKDMKITEVQAYLLKAVPDTTLNLIYRGLDAYKLQSVGLSLILLDLVKIGIQSTYNAVAGVAADVKETAQLAIATRR